MDINNLSPYVRIAWDNTMRMSDPIRPRILYDYEIIYVREGDARFLIEDREYIAMPGDIFFIRPNQEHAIFRYQAICLRQPHIHFDLFYRTDSPATTISFKPYAELSEAERALIREDVCTMPPFDLPEKLRVHSIRRFEELLDAVIDEYQMKRPFWEISVKAKFLDLFVYLLREHAASQPAPKQVSDTVRDIHAYIRAHVREPLTLEQLSYRFNISKFHLVRIFRAAYGMPPIQYHQAARMEKIKEMILYTNTSLTDIALDFGYKNINIFSRAFKRAERIPPSALRK